MNIIDLEKFKKIYSISDIHGNLPALLYSLNDNGLTDDDGTLNIEPEAALVINGDVFDYFFKKGTEDIDLSKSDILKSEDWAYGILSTYQVSNVELISLVDWVYGSNQELPYLSLLTQRLSINKIKLEVVGALSVLELLAFLDIYKKLFPNNLYMLFGNHDLDFISGEWQYRSLQKNIIFSIFRNNLIIEYLEFKDIKLSLPVITYNSHLLNQKEDWIASGSKISSLFDEKYCFAISNDSVYVHGGIPKEMLLECAKTDLNINILSEILSKYSTKKAGINSIFTCDEEPDIPTSNVELIKIFLNRLHKKRLVVGHNPFLGIEADSPIDLSIESINRTKVFSVCDLGYVVKSDTGIKYGNSQPVMYKEKT